MANFELHQATCNHFPRDRFLPNVPHQPQNHAPQNLEVPPAAAANGQLEGHMEYMAHGEPVGGVTGPGRPHDHDPADIAYHGMIDYRPLPIRDPPVPYVFPDAGAAQGTPAQGRPNGPENQEHVRFRQVPQHVPPLLPGAAFPDPFIHRIPAPEQRTVENLRKLAIRYVHHPDSHVDLVSMEPGAAGFCKVVIVLELADVF